MESKCLKKSSIQQLTTLVEYMGENADFARGLIKFGNTKMSLEEQWKSLTFKLNSMGPPSRSVVEWKKTWTDMKSRTKKKIAENKRCLQQTGGGLYRQHHLTDLEEIIDRTLFLSKSANPSGTVHGLNKESENNLSIDNCFQILVDTPPRGTKNVAVITPTPPRGATNVAVVTPTRGMQPLQKQQTFTSDVFEVNSSQQPHRPQAQQYSPKQSHSLQQTHTTTNTQHVAHTHQHQYSRQTHSPEHTFPFIQIPDNNQNNINNTRTTSQQQQQIQTQNTPEQAHTSRRPQAAKRYQDDTAMPTSSHKKRKIVNEQFTLIRQQIRVSEEAARSAKEQASATKTLAEAVCRMADAAEKQAEAATAQTHLLSEILSVLKNNSNK